MEIRIHKSPNTKINHLTVKQLINNNNKLINISNEKILLPHKTNLNNLKTNKYFTIDDSKNDIMKNALLSYRKNKNLNKYMSDINSNLQYNTFESSSTCTDHLIAHKTNNNFIAKSNKIFPTILDTSKNENTENNLNTINNEDEFNDSGICNKNNNSIKDEKKIKPYISEMQNLVNINNYSIFDEDSFNDDINNIITESNNYNNFNDKINSNQCMTERNVLINLSYRDINLNDFLLINNIFNELIHDFDVYKMHCFENIIKTTQKFFKICENSKNSQIYEIFDINSLNNLKKNFVQNNLCLLVKEYLILQLIYFYILALISLINKNDEKIFFLSGIQKITEYLQQNCIIFIYIIINNSKIQNEFINDNVVMKNIAKLIKENKYFLNENSYKKSIVINNKGCKEIINNLLKQIKNIFNNDNTITKSNTKINKILFSKIKNNINAKNKFVKICKKNKTNSNNNNTNNENNNISNTDFIETIINLFTIYLKNIHKVKFTSFLKDLKNTPSILNLLSITNIYPNPKFLPYPNLNSKNLTNTFKNISKNVSKNFSSMKSFIPTHDSQNKYTLVLDLEGTLIHYVSNKNSGFIKIRPNVEIFLKTLSNYYEIVLFSDSLQKFTEMSLKDIDKENYIKYKFYRQHCLNVGGIYIKDLDKIGRDIKKIIIIDNCSDCFCLQPKNGLNITEFYGNEKDNELEYLKKDLINLAIMEPNDVRYYLKDIQNNMDKRINPIHKYNNTYDEDFFDENNNYKEEKKKEMDMEKIPEIIYEYDGTTFGSEKIVNNS